jgi:N-acetyl-anhydromuramyl-L-alanine amidase AmpD
LGNAEIKVLGLGENALDKHAAPGPLFPWNKLAGAGIGIKIELPSELSSKCTVRYGDSGDKLLSLQNGLAAMVMELVQQGFMMNLRKKLYRFLL